MPTFLTTRKMSPALAKRVEASVRNARAQGERSWPIKGVARIVVVLGLIVGFWMLVASQRRDARELEAARTTLLDEARAAAAPVTAADRQTVARVDTLLVRMASVYDGDLVTDEARGSGAIAALLARQTIYVRGPISR